MLVIGKSNKFWTLWSSTSTESEVRYSYIKNISFDLEEAKSKYPEAPVLEWLRGTKEFSVAKATKREFEVGKLHFGKHAGKLVEDVPTSYLAWLVGNLKMVANDEQEWFNETLPRIEKVLNKNGYGIFNDDFGNLAAIKLDAIKESPYDSKIANNEEFEVEIPRNLSECGDIRVKNTVLAFESYKEMEYAGYKYGLPTINGKAKRIKGKPIVIEEYKIRNAENARVYDGDDVYLTFNELLVTKWRMA